MRFILKYAVCLHCVLSALYSCTKPSDGGQGSLGTSNKPAFTEYIFALNGVDFMEEGDSLMVYVPGTSLVSQIITPQEGVMLPVKINNPLGLTSGDTLSVCTPCSSLLRSQHSYSTVLSIPSVQKQTGGHFNFSNFPLVNTPFVVEGTLPSSRKELAGTIYMNPLYAVARFDIGTIQHTHVGQAIESVSFTSDGLAGNFTYDMLSDSLEIPELDTDTVKTEVTDLFITSVGGFASVYMALAPGEHSGTVTVKIGNDELTYLVENALFERGTTTPVELFVQGDIIGGSETFDPSEDFDWEE